MTKILRALIEKVDNMKEEMGDKNTEVENDRKESKGDMKNQKHGNRNEECI